jgi:acetyl esterase/lipase
MGEILLQLQSARAAFCQLQLMARIASRDSASGRERPVARRGEAYARKLKEAGVSVDADRYSGTIHDFGLLNALRHVPSTEARFDAGSRTSCNPTRYMMGLGYKPGPGLPID